MARRTVAEQLGLEGTSFVSRAITRLRLAQEAYDAGRPLVCGECPEQVPDGITAWLRQRRPSS